MNIIVFSIINQTNLHTFTRKAFHTIFTFGFKV